MARADCQPLAAKDRVQPSLQNNYSHFGVGVDRSWNSRIGRNRHFFDVERLAALIGSHQDATLHPWGGPYSLGQTLFVNDRHLYPFHHLPEGVLHQ